MHKVFYVCPTARWGTLEKLVIKNALICQENGMDVLVYCLRDSLLHEEAIKEKIPCVFHQGKTDTKITNWYKLITLPTFKFILS